MVVLTQRQQEAKEPLRATWVVQTEVPTIVAEQAIERDIAQALAIAEQQAGAVQQTEAQLHHIIEAHQVAHQEVEEPYEAEQAHEAAEVEAPAEDASGRRYNSERGCYF